MNKREKLCLQLRNRKGQENETYCKHYIKSKGVYLRSVFFGFYQSAIFIVAAILTAVLLLVELPDEDGIFNFVLILLLAVFAISYLFIIFKGLWYWKYTRHVFVTDEGIWFMSCSALWWKGAPDFTGKRRFLAPSWSLYSWSELKSVSKDVIDKNRSSVRLANFFEDWDEFVIKSSKHSPIYLKRWDGVEIINCLKNDDVDEILAYSKERMRAIRAAKRKNKKAKDAEDNYDLPENPDLPDEE